ncbi:FIST C-terminal domain-containing protein [Hydrogenimonas thermophila]|uniref:FIST C-terminal domain-containing protein n=1 Tax=Hydrogenimonas thermophila TaxID=223786 RepID=UPI002936DAE5|nr:FIST C-terminal domain-containing protein [Hydrogenimonas thermophila]WOE70792.1 FIST C-terminal domain-containing protein [Hydrogenimonas thermophila]WOE73310.1 FIST C-terminal domain-containing protein [Hydrogenimonas thermophila]
MHTKVYSSSNSSLYLSLKELKESLKKDFENIDFLLFSIHPEYSCDVNESIQEVFGKIDYAAFYAIDAFKNREITNKAVTVTAFKFEKNTKIKKFWIEDIRNYENSDSLQQTAQYLNNNHKDFHIILASHAEERFGCFLVKLSENINYNPVNNIIGGISSGMVIDNELRSWQFTNDTTIKNGFLILSFENVEADIGISLGFKPYGITYKISKAEQSKLYTVDGHIKFSEIVKRLQRGIENPDPKYLWYLPLNILDEQDGYVSTLRIIERIEDDYVKLFGPVDEGQHFKLSFATADELINSDIETVNILKEKMKSPDIVFNFSCVARQYILDDKQQKEIEIYADAFDAPLFGFFTFGEIGPDKMHKKLKLYNETSLIIAMREK